VVSPAAAIGVTAESSSPHGLALPFDVLLGERGRGSLGSPPPASALVLVDLTLAVLPRAAVLLRSYERHHHPSMGLRGPSGFHRKTAAMSSAPVGLGHGPSPGVQLPPAVASAKDPGIPGASTSPADASSGFEPSRRLDPLRAFPTFLPGPLLGLLPSGLFSSRRSGPSFEAPYPPGIA